MTNGHRMVQSGNIDLAGGTRRTRGQLSDRNIIYTGLFSISLAFVILSLPRAFDSRGTVGKSFVTGGVHEGQSAFSSPAQNVSTATQSHKVILLWNSLYHRAYYGLRPGNKYFERMNCPSDQCEATVDRRRAHEADAIVIHTFMLPKHIKYLPIRNNQRQIFVFILFESPLVANQNGWLSSLADTFNLTWTYLDSADTDITVPHSLVTAADYDQTLSVPTVETARGKTKLVAWVVSNCHAKSLRREYVDKLRAHIPVDVYGDCGNLTCPNNNNECFDNLSDEYFFYLAFENAYCDDYISEKFFRTLTLSMIPVVLGGANYSKYAPPKSFIDVRSFSSPAELARFLTRLSTDLSEYIRYFQWRRDWRIIKKNVLVRRGFCDLCAILHNASYIYKRDFDPEAYWNTSSLCRTGRAEAQSLHLSLNNRM